MALRKPLVLINGQRQQLPSGDTLDAPQSGGDVIALTNDEAGALIPGNVMYIDAVMNRKPLVIADGQRQQLQAGDELDIPLEERHAELQRKFDTLCRWVLETFNDIPPSLMESALAGEN